MATETEIEAALDGFYMRQADSMHDRMAAAVAALDRVRADDTRPQDEDHETEPHQAEDQCPECGAPSASPPAEVYCVECATKGWEQAAIAHLVQRAEFAEAEVARLRAERDEAERRFRSARDVATARSGDLRAAIARAEEAEARVAELEAERDHQRQERWRVAGELAEALARVAELEAERDLARDAIRAQNERQIAELRKAKEGVQDRIDRAVTERTEAMVESAERCLNDWGRGAGIGGMGRFVYEHLRREFPVPTRTREASDGD